MARVARVATTSGEAPATAVPTTRRRGAKAEETRERILDATMNVLAESGFRGMRVAEVAKRVGITEAGVLHHYPSKQALLDAVLEYRERPSRLFSPEAHDLHGLAAIMALADVAKLIESNPVRAQLLIVLKAEGFGPEKIAVEYLAKRERNLHKSITRYLREGQRDGDIRDDIDVRKVSMEITAMMSGLNLQWFTLGKSFSLTAAWENYFARLARDIGTGKKPRR